MFSFLRRAPRKPPATPAPFDGAPLSAEIAALRGRVERLEASELERAVAHTERVSKLDSLIKRLDVRAKRAEKSEQSDNGESTLSMRRRLRGT